MKTIPEPFPHQEECFERFKDSEYLALLADMGTGKSRMAIDIITHKVKLGMHNRVVVIGPVSVHPQWLSEQFPLHYPLEYTGYSFKPNNLMKDIRERDKFMMFAKNDPSLRVFTINFESFVGSQGMPLVTEFCNTSTLPPIFIIDEASRIKNPDAKTVMEIMKLRDMYPDSWRVVLTGTPSAKSPVDMWSIYDFLHKNYFRCSHQAFKVYHEIQVDSKRKINNRLVTTRGTIDPYTQKKLLRMIKKNKDDEGKLGDIQKNYIMGEFGLSSVDFDIITGSEKFVRFKNVDKLQEKCSPVTFSVAKKDCLILPDKVYEQKKFKLSAEQKRLIKSLKKHAVAEYGGEVLTVSQKAVLGTRVLQICGQHMAHHTDVEGEFDTTLIKGPNAKMDFILSDLDEIGDQQYIVWAVFKAEVELINQKLSKKHNVDYIYGDTKNAARPEIIEAFKAGELQGLIANPGSCGYGLNLQCASVQYWYSRNYRTEVRLQSEDRSHRIGTTISPVYKDLLYDIAFEEQVLRVLQEGKDVNDMFVTTSLNSILAF